MASVPCCKANFCACSSVLFAIVRSLMPAFLRCSVTSEMVSPAPINKAFFELRSSKILEARKTAA